jgi:hypothetical protein
MRHYSHSKRPWHEFWHELATPAPSEVESRADKFKSQFLSRLHQLKTNPFAYGNLTVRSLLDLREHCLVEFDFHDPYLKQKQMENDQVDGAELNLNIEQRT